MDHLAKGRGYPGGSKNERVTRRQLCPLASTCLLEPFHFTPALFFFVRGLPASSDLAQVVCRNLANLETPIYFSLFFFVKCTSIRRSRSYSNHFIMFIIHQEMSHQSLRASLPCVPPFPACPFPAPTSSCNLSSTQVINNL